MCSNQNSYGLLLGRSSHCHDYVELHPTVEYFCHQEDEFSVWALPSTKTPLLQTEGLFYRIVHLYRKSVACGVLKSIKYSASYTLSHEKNTKYIVSNTVLRLRYEFYFSPRSFYAVSRDIKFSFGVVC